MFATSGPTVTIPFLMYYKLYPTLPVKDMSVLLMMIILLRNFVRMIQVCFFYFILQLNLLRKVLLV
jgi:hypothetical protein